MQSLEIISLNIWNILISLLNLVIMYLILKRFLFKPVKKFLKQRQEQLDKSYDDARVAEEKALESKAQWEEKLSSADNEAEAILQSAKQTAERKKDAIVAGGEAEAQRIIKSAEADAALERKKAEQDIKEQIVGVSVELSKKMLGREINSDDHGELIDDFISKIGDADGESE